MENSDPIISTESTIQITNIGGQTLPVLQGILEFSSSLNILLHSEESLPIAKKIADLVDGQFKLEKINDANDFGSIISLITKVVDKYPDSIFYVNVSGGTKVMTLALYSFFINSNLKSHIFHIDQNGMIHHLREKTSCAIKNTLPIDQFIAFSGQRIKSKTNVEDIPQPFFETSKWVKKLFDQKNYDFNVLTNKYRALKRKENNNEDFELLNERTYSQIRWSKVNDELSISLANKYRTGYDEYIFNGKKNIGIILETKWFELELVNIFQKWDKTRELAWSVIVPYIEGSDKNEIDIIVNLGNKLLFVECKTQVFDIKDIDKLRNTAKTYGGLGSKAILITYCEPNKRTIEKCSDNNILLFSFTNPDKSSNSATDLYNLLNSHISKSNTF